LLTSSFSVNIILEEKVSFVCDFCPKKVIGRCRNQRELRLVFQDYFIGAMDGVDRTDRLTVRAPAAICLFDNLDSLPDEHQSLATANPDTETTPIASVKVYPGHLSQSRLTSK
jgi:hypothetical protein